MARARKAKERAAPVSVAVTPRLRDEFEDEARRRGLGLSTTLRTLAVERVAELREQRQLDRARRWQTDRMLALIERIERGEIGEATDEEIDAIFEREGIHGSETSTTS